MRKTRRLNEMNRMEDPEEERRKDKEKRS
jgi:hypothetical protein